MKNTTVNPNAYAAREKKTSWYAALSVLVWAITVTLSSAALTHLSVPKLLFGIFALLISVVIGLAAIVAYIRWLKALDEMMRKIWVESMALTLGALWIAFGALIILEAADINYIGTMDIGLLTILAGLGMATGAIRIAKYR